MPVVLQIVSSTGYYGAERWIVAFANNCDPAKLTCQLAVVTDSHDANAEIVEHFPSEKGAVFRLEANGPFDLTVFMKLKRLIRSQSVDIVHSHGYKSDLIALVAARLSGIRCVSTPHGYGNVSSRKLRGYFWLDRKILRWFDRVVPLSHDLARQLRDAGVPAARLSIIENAVDLSAVRALRNDLPPPSDRCNRRLGYVGRLDNGKQVDHLIETFAELRTEFPDLELMLAGEGGQREALEARTRDLGVRQAVDFRGFVSNGLEAIASVDLFMMASESEGIPRCVMEAMALEKPVVAYDIPGVRELVDDGRTGRLAPLNDKAALTRHTRELLLNPASAAALGAAGRERIEQRFSGERMAREYLALFQSMLSGDDDRVRAESRV